jgi:hypothetical protein
MLTPMIVLLTLASLVLSFVLIGAIVGLLKIADHFLRYHAHKRLVKNPLSHPHAELSAFSL